MVPLMHQLGNVMRSYLTTSITARKNTKNTRRILVVSMVSSLLLLMELATMERLASQEWFKDLLRTTLSSIGSCSQRSASLEDFSFTR